MQLYQFERPWWATDLLDRQEYPTPLQAYKWNPVFCNKYLSTISIYRCIRQTGLILWSTAIVLMSRDNVPNPIRHLGSIM